MNSRQRLTLGAGLLLVAALARGFHLQTASLWFDEAFSVIAARAPVAALWQGAADPVLPPFYFIVLHGWQGLVGESELAVRWLSALVSLLAVPLSFRLGARLFDRQTGWSLAVLMAFAPFQIYYAQEARPYAMCVVVASALGWVGIEAVARSGWWWWGAYTALAIVGLYTHYFFAFPIVALHLCFIQPRSIPQTERRGVQELLAWPAGAGKWTWILADVIVLAAFAPQVGTALARTQAVTSNFWIERPSLLSALKTFDFLCFAITTPTWLVPVALFGVLGVVAILALDLTRVLRSQHRWRLGVGLCLGWLGLPLGAAFVVSQFGSSVYLDRSFALITPAYYALFALGWRAAPARLPVRWLMGVLVVVAAVSMGTYYFWPNTTKPDFRTAAAVARPHIRPGDYFLNLHDSTYFSMQYYLFPIAASDQAVILDTDNPWLMPSAWPRFGIHVPDTWVEAMPSGARLWVVIEPRLFDSRQSSLFQLLRREWQTAQIVERMGVELYLFMRR